MRLDAHENEVVIRKGLAAYPRFRFEIAEWQKGLRHRLKRTAVNRAGTMFMESLQMQLGAVTLVLTETILREMGAKFQHQAVARQLRNDARGGDAQAQTIAVNDRGLREREWKNRETIDQDMVWRNR